MATGILIIDDNIKLCKSLAQNFDQLGYRSHFAENSAKAFDILSKHNVDVVLLDIVLGKEDGISVLDRLLSWDNKLPVIMITGYGSIETAVKSVKLGAFDYIQKPLNFNNILKIVENAIRLANLKSENQRLKNRIVALTDRIITRSPKMIDLCNKAKRLAETDIPVLIIGENGTGKELLANFIHNNSRRSAYQINTINCAAFPETLLDNELFGHEKGAYTGADATFIGIFEKADGGTLHLDEIGDMAPSTQAKILRTLQNHEIRRIGGNKSITIDVRFIASTNKDIQGLIDKGRFREDLYYRINAATLHIPPLKERMDDIPVLVNHFLSFFSNNNSKALNRVPDDVLKCFCEYHWPGNIRELKNTINYAATMSTTGQIRIEDLPASFMDMEKKESGHNIREETEKMLILRMLKQSDYNKRKTAALLQISRKTLYNKLKKYGISLTGTG
ncbi:Response regulator of zinc sigma-54-dependent two-component system [Olavius sp. associated proteobacterium Delta 1]|nr:Response regulator of zinc sigma-54-dependent two-component system [Olavius sp. associated proteobacterium Delta 1]